MLLDWITARSQLLSIDSRAGSQECRLLILFLSPTFFFLFPLFVFLFHQFHPGYSIPFPRTRFSSPFRFPSPWSRSSSSASSTFIFFSKQMKSGRHRPWREPFLTFTPIFFQTFPFRETFLARVLSIALLSGRPRNLKQ